MRPLDPRLLRHARAARRYVLLTTGLGVLTTGLVVAQALLLAAVITDVVLHGAGPDRVRTQLLVLLAVVLGRAVVAGAQERFGHRAATDVVRQLRAALLDRAAARVSTPDSDPRTPTGAALALLTTRGLDALDGYLTRYLPQLLLAATLTPAILVVILWKDTVAGVTVALTLPLIPLFMALVGRSSQAAADRGLHTLQRLGAQVLDLIAGLPTLQALGVAAGPAQRVRQVGEAHRRATMRTLRSAFLSALVMETLTTLSVALVAVGVGLRLVDGDLGLRTGLAVLLLAPEVYLPLRNVGVHFHASVDGLAAAQQAFTFLELPVTAPGTRPAPDLRHATIRWDQVSIVHPGARQATPGGLTAELRPGEIVALTGASGVGKSSALAALLGLRPPDQGRITIDDDAEPCGPEADLREIDPASWWRQIAWVPQHPAVLPGTLAENVRLTATEAGQDAVDAAARLTGFDAVVAGCPDGWATRVGQGGIGLSAGQRQRLALTRVLLADAPLVVLDEPTAHLDATAEQAVLAVIGALRTAGRTVVLVAHRPALAALADRTIAVTSQDPKPDDQGMPTGSTAPGPAERLQGERVSDVPDEQLVSPA